MKPAAPLIIAPKTLALIMRLANEVNTSSDDKAKLCQIIMELPLDEKRDLLALWYLGRPGSRSFNKAWDSAKRYKMEHLPGYLTGGTLLKKNLTDGLKRHKAQSA